MDDNARTVVFWDFDGTLALAPGLWRKAVWNELLATLPDTSCSPESVHPLTESGFPWHEPEVDHRPLILPGAWWAHMERHFAGMYRRLGIEDGLAGEMAGRIRARILDLANYSLLPGAAETLRACRERGCENWLFSNHVPELERIVAGLGLRDRFDGCVVSANIGWDKPNPEAFRIALEMAGDPEIRYMVGDNPVADIDGAKRAGMTAIRIAHGTAGAATPPGLLPADFTCTRLPDILDCIR